MITNQPSLKENLDKCYIKICTQAYIYNIVYNVLFMKKKENERRVDQILF